MYACTCTYRLALFTISIIHTICTVYICMLHTYICYIYMYVLYTIVIRYVYIKIYIRNMYVCTNYVQTYTYKFSRDVNFADDSNLGFSRFYFVDHLISHLVFQVYYNCFMKFQGFKFHG